MSRAKGLTLIVFTAALMQATSVALRAAEKQLSFHDPTPQRYELSARASQIDPRAQPHPEINFVFEENGKPADVENASVDNRVKLRGELVIWMMGYSEPLFERVNSYLFTHPVEQVGRPVPHDANCPMDLRPAASGAPKKNESTRP